MNCKCDDDRHNLGTVIWHRAYCNWYNHDRAGHTLRSSLWGFVADRTVRLA